MLPIPNSVLRRLARLGAFNPAGGVNYHLRAREHGKRRWEPFRWALGEWLLAWAPPEKHLILVGPSAGYNLQPFLLERFERVIALEPDPLARWLFARRLARTPLDPRPHLELIRDDHLVRHPERLEALLTRSEPAALLFCNIVGQLVHLIEEDPPDERLRAIQRGVRAAIAGRSWASFHDRFSGPLAPSIEGQVRASQRWSDEEVIANAYAAGGSALPVELTDHQTDGFFPHALPHAYFHWDLGPGDHHLVEAVACVGPARAALEPPSSSAAGAERPSP